MICVLAVETGSIVAIIHLEEGVYGEAWDSVPGAVRGTVCGAAEAAVRLERQAVTPDSPLRLGAFTKHATVCTVLPRSLHAPRSLPSTPTDVTPPQDLQAVSRELEAHVRRLEGLKKEVKKMETMEVEVKSRLRASEELLQTKDALLQAKEALLKEAVAKAVTAAELSEKEAKVTKVEAELSEKEAKLTKLEAELSEKGAGLIEKEADLTRNEAELSEKREIWVRETAAKGGVVEKLEAEKEAATKVCVCVCVCACVRVYICI